ncbi:MAG: hypothetical protein HUJ52_00870 [Malacoplasma sp.]|nr:hypothetical protein [Malacoplasma sp.]
MNEYSQYCETVNQETAFNQFEDNYCGVLTHNGEIKVAKCDVEHEIIHVDENGNVMVRCDEKSYSPLIHTNLLPLMDYVVKGDIAFIKFKKDEAYLVGFRKNKKEGKHEKNNS